MNLGGAFVAVAMAVLFAGALIATVAGWRFARRYVEVNDPRANRVWAVMRFRLRYGLPELRPQSDARAERYRRAMWLGLLLVIASFLMLAVGALLAIARY